MRASLTKATNMKALLSALAAVMFLTGCSSFHGKWKTALAQPAPADSIAGPWEGRWLSAKNGHTGRLRAVLTPGETNTYTAHFHATFWKIFRAAYEVPFIVTNTPSGFAFTGRSDLGPLSGGVYTYEGAATPAEFRSSYRCKWDHGDFEMARPAPALR